MAAKIRNESFNLKVLMKTCWIVMLCYLL